MSTYHFKIFQSTIIFVTGSDESINTTFLHANYSEYIRSSQFVEGRMDGGNGTRRSAGAG